MSNALAIASVTAVLKDLLNNGLIDHDVSATLGNVKISALSPDRIDATSPNQQSQLNLFLYQVSHNVAWRNADLPARNSQGDRTSNPPLALNLHYLLTAYGALEFHAEILLGYGMQLFHETPVLTRDAIRTALAPPSPVSGGGGLPAEMQALFTSELAEQVEQIKIVPETLNSEEISRMWTAFQAHYRPTAAYQASVVLIESKQVTKSALPVRTRKVFVDPFNRPVIEEFKSQTTPGSEIISGAPILAGQNLVISGSGLKSNSVFVNVGGIDKRPADSDVTDTQIILPVPPEIKAGVQGVQVIHFRLLGSPPALHRGVESNLMAFVLRPTVTNLNFTAGSGPAVSGSIAVTADPPIGDLQRVVLLLNEIVPIPPPPLTSPPAEIKAESYSFEAPARMTLSPPSGPPGAKSTITIPIEGVKAGSYLVRLQVDGAESVPQSDATGQFIGPKITIA